MLIDWGTINNSLNCDNIQISTDVELKILGTTSPFENFDEFLKWFNSSEKI
jgi:hypothetical protein